MSPLAKKLQMKAGSRWLLYNAPAEYVDLLSPLPDNFILTNAIDGGVDGIQLFVKSKAELTKSLADLKELFKGDITLWVIYPKKTSGIISDLEMMNGWDEMDNYKLTSVAAAAVDATWTALRFRPMAFSKKAETRNEEIAKNEFAQYIDVTNKTVTPPADAIQLMQENPSALNFYQSLSYSNRKEYILWIVTAKQEKTRAERLAKMIEKLLAGKKNPSEK